MKKPSAKSNPPAGRQDRPGTAGSDPAQAASRPVTSNQTGPHARLPEVVQRHAQTPWRQPLHPPTVRTFEKITQLIDGMGEKLPLVIDAACGTGLSTRRLAQHHPDALVLGLDQSAARLAQVGAQCAPRRDGRVVWARVELASFWRLALAAGWRVQYHYILYPNPWPKSAHLGRRWHGHPVFPDLLALGGILELRSNWEIYVREFSLALGEMDHPAPEPVQFVPDPGAALTPFEAKYHASGHTLWRLKTNELTKEAI